MQCTLFHNTVTDIYVYHSLQVKHAFIFVVTVVNYAVLSVH